MTAALFLNWVGRCDHCGGTSAGPWAPDPRYAVCASCGHCCAHKAAGSGQT